MTLIIAGPKLLARDRKGSRAANSKFFHRIERRRKEKLSWVSSQTRVRFGSVLTLSQKEAQFSKSVDVNSTVKQPV